jgi:hypothetical protein
MTASIPNDSFSGDSVGKILILGRTNPFANKKSFDVTGSIKNLSFSQYQSFMSESALPISEGALQFKVKALCHENQADIDYQVRLDGLRFSTELPPNQAPLIFGLEPASIVNFFNRQTQQSFEFGFRVLGDLGDPAFNIFSETAQKMEEALRNQISERMKTVEAKAAEITG